MTPPKALPEPHTVLITDSDQEDRDFLCGEFRCRGYRVLEAEDCEGTLDALAAHRVDAVVLDLELSCAQRASLMRKMLSGKYGRPSVFLLVSPSVLSREEAYGLGATFVLSKPLEPAYLISRIAEILTPAPSRWRRETAPARSRHSLAASMFKHQLGRGGFAVSGGLANELFEGETVEFNMEVKDVERWTLRGTGIVRYVNIDAKSRRQRAWGIEFESLDELSMTHLLKEKLGDAATSPYIPPCVG